MAHVRLGALLLPTAAMVNRCAILRAMHRKLFRDCAACAYPVYVCVLLAALGACSSKTLQYPEDHERFRRIEGAEQQGNLLARRNYEFDL